MLPFFFNITALIYKSMKTTYIFVVLLIISSCSGGSSNIIEEDDSGIPGDELNSINETCTNTSRNGVDKCDLIHDDRNRFYYLYVPDNLLDGFGFLQIQIPNWNLDAAPSRPIFFPV